jgi:hypothetical protein
MKTFDEESLIVRACSTTGPFCCQNEYSWDVVLLRNFDRTSKATVQVYIHTPTVVFIRGVGWNGRRSEHYQKRFFAEAYVGVVKFWVNINGCQMRLSLSMIMKDPYPFCA